jgi:copper chaperone NosL
MLLSLLLACAGVPDSPPPLDYDRAACSSCGMLVSEPRFAAELVTTGGDLRTYDDPACLFRDIVATKPSIARLWFRDSSTTEERWISWTEVAFVPATGAPMNGGYAAVPLGTPGAIGFGEASSTALQGSQP